MINLKKSDDFRRALFFPSTYSTYPKFGDTRARARESYGEIRFLSAIQKLQFLSDRDDFFLAVAIMGSINLIFFQIFPIKGKVGLKWIPIFGNTL